MIKSTIIQLFKQANASFYSRLHSPFTINLLTYSFSAFLYQIQDQLTPIMRRAWPAFLLWTLIFKN